MFRSGWTVTEFRGIPIRVHPSLIFVLPLMAVAISGQQLPQRFISMGVSAGEIIVPPVLYGLGLSLALFAAILLHEMGHAAAALRYGMPVRSITLMILGGVTEIHQDNATPKETFLVALAGPAVNIALGAIFLIAARVIPSSWTDLMIFCLLFGGLNLLIAVFNLLPSMPLDGGRMLKSALSLSMEPGRAAKVTGVVGRTLALAGGIYGLMQGQLLLVLLCGFLYFGAGADQLNTSIREAIDGLVVRQAMTVRVTSVDPSSSLPSAARHMLVRDAQVALIRDIHGTYGVVQAQALYRARAKCVGDLVQGDPLFARIDDPLTEVVQRMQWEDKPVIVRDLYNTPVGVVTYDDVVRAARLRILADTGLEGVNTTASSEREEA